MQAKRGRGRVLPTPLLTSALDGGEWSAHASALLYPWGKGPQYQLDRRLFKISGMGSEWILGRLAGERRVDPVGSG
jgi:hypothetical protein